MPDFRMQPSFPIADVINAAQKKGQLDNQTTMQQSQLFNNALTQIGTVAQSLHQQKQKVAQALAIGKQIGVPDDLARTMDPTQLLKIDENNKWANRALANGIDPGQVSSMFHALSGRKPSDELGAMPAQNTSAQPASTNGPILASNVTTSPMPDATQASLPPATTGQMSDPSQAVGGSAPVPIAAPPVKPKMINPATANFALKLAAMANANRPTPVMTTADALAQGSVPKGTMIKDEKTDSSDTNSTKNQEKLEKQYIDLKAKFLSARSGPAGIENGKVDQAIHLRKSINQQYDPKTGQYNIPPSLHTEYVLGLARLMSPNGQVAADTMNQLRQRTAREGAANVLISMGFDPEEVGGTTQSVAKFFVKQIDRQGQTAEENRAGYMDYIHGQAPTDLDPARIAKHDKVGLNSFNDLLAKSPDQKAASTTGYEFTNPEKERRYQEFKKRQSL